MKKQLLSIIAALTVGSVIAQPSADWSISQNAAFTNTSVGIKFLDAVDQNVVWVIGYDGFAPNRNYNWFSRTIDGGNTFTAGTVFSDTNTWVISNMEGINASTAWVCSFGKAAQGGGSLHRTTDGGQTWVNMTAPGMYTNSTSFGNFVTFLTPSVGVCNGDPVNGEFELWRTTNGGLTWSQIPGANIPNPLSAGEFAIVNLYAKHGTTNIWFGTNQGRMYRSTDAGLTWNVSQVAATTSTLTEIAFSTPLNGLAYVVNNTPAFELWSTSDGGVTWTQLPGSPNLGLNDVCAVPGTPNFVSVGAGTGNQIISYSTDFGATWIDYGSTNIQYLTVDFADNQNGWAGSFSDNVNPSLGGIWKYSGPAIGGNTPPTSAFIMSQNLCLTAASVTAATTNSSTGTPALTYSWSAAPAGVAFSSATAANPVITFTATGTYTVSLEVTNAYGSNISSQVINVLACSAPTVNFTMPQSGCTKIALTTTNTSTGGVPVPSYSWSASSNQVTFLPSAAVQNPSVSILSPGTYTVYLTATSDLGTVQASQTVTVVSCAPTASFDIPATIYACDIGNPQRILPLMVAVNNTSVVANGGSNTYSWTIAPTNSVQSSSPLGVNYSVTVRHVSIPVYTVTLRATNASGTSSLSQTFAVDFLCTGLEENGALANMEVYPNPAREQLTVSLPNATGGYSVKLVNVLGAVVYENKVSGSTGTTIKISEQPKGVYFLSVESQGEKITKKIIIE